jgi:dethiobiotin synthetase
MTGRRGLFVTGTDTGAGKTLVSCSILAALAARGLRVAACKPVETGCRRMGDGLEGEDCRRLAEAAGGRVPASGVAAYLFPEPAAPLVAAEAAGVRIERRVLLDHFAVLAGDAEFVLVESAGGLLVPVAEGLTTRDLAIDLGLPAVCVVASRLGCINHALLTLESMRRSGLEVAGWVLNEVAPNDAAATTGDEARAAGDDVSKPAPSSAHDETLARRTNEAVLRRFTKERFLGRFPFVEPGHRDDLDHLAALAARCLDLDAILR